MANASYAKSLIRSLPDPVRRGLEPLLDYLFGNLRLGRCQAGSRAENLQLYALSGTTHGTPGEEFSMAHGLGVAPYLLLPVLPLDTVGAALVPLTVTRVADSQRVYLSSSVADAPVRVLVEG
jgi:hypothetical protein